MNATTLRQDSIANFKGIDMLMSKIVTSNQKPGLVSTKLNWDINVENVNDESKIRINVDKIELGY